MSSDVAALLREAHLRVTPARLAIVAVVTDYPHTDADKVIHAVREKIGSVSTQAVYDSLHALVGAGILRRIEPAGHPALYETRIDDNHHHLVCRNCGVLADVDCAVGHRPCLTPADTAGFAVDEAEVIYWGLCPACQASA